MNIDEALNLLNLDRNYTKEDLKREYRKLIMKYHPDKHDNGDKTYYEEKTKLLNEARNILNKNLDNKEDIFDSNWNNMTKEKYDDIYEKEIEKLNKLKELYKEEIRNELDYVYDIDSRDKLFMEWKERFLEVIYDFYNCIDRQPNWISLQLNYEVYKKEYFELKCWYLYDCWSKTKIIDFAGNLGIDKNDNFRSVRNKMRDVVRTILDIEMEEFKYIDNYSEIKSLLIEIRNAYVDVCIYGYDTIDNIKNKFKNKIVVEINKYNKRKEIVDSLTKYYGYPNKLIVELYNNILNEDIFNSLYNDKIDLKTKVKVRVKNMFSK